MTKKILITGKNSYVGNQLAEWLNKDPEKYEVVKESVRDDKWKEIDFSVFDVVVHVAGIAHMKETKKNKMVYYKVNRDLTHEIAKYAKRNGVKHFIFLSTMSVYGLEVGHITGKTQVNPKSAYGDSKLQAENLVLELEDEDFCVAIVRPPMVYGKNGKGNYGKLSEFAIKYPVFPEVRNERSMIYIDNLSEYIKILIDNVKRGFCFPQNENYVNISQMVKMIAEVNNKKIRLVKIFNPILPILKLGIIRKVFGSLTYDKSMSSFQIDYQKKSFKESIIRTER